jgi:hypothetical protein
MTDLSVASNPARNPRMKKGSRPEDDCLVLFRNRHEKTKISRQDIADRLVFSLFSVQPRSALLALLSPARAGLSAPVRRPRFLRTFPGSSLCHVAGSAVKGLLPCRSL